MPERVSPQAGMSDETLEHHLKRYEFAKDYIKGKVILSVACGNGYGEHMFATDGGAQKVIGVDVSEEAITFAKENYSADNLEFFVGDALRLGLPDDSVDVVVSFETIEHIEDDRGYLKELKRVLRPGGTALISTPNRAKSLSNYVSRKPLNPYHVREYLRSELMDLLGGYFDNITLYGQKVILCRRLMRLPQYILYKIFGKLTTLEVRDYEVREYPTDTKYETVIFVAVCT
jgi:ubiquinone/menaquinone biosynthesis C-methylase UbiE